MTWQDIVVLLALIGIYAWNYRIGHPEWNPIKLGHLIRLNKKSRM